MMLRLPYRRSLPFLLALFLISAAAAEAYPSQERIIFRTSLGDLVFKLYPETAPRHAAQITRLVKSGIYDSTFIYRVEPGFLIQFVDHRNRRLPLTREQEKQVLPIPVEISSRKHARGILTMARHEGDLNSAESSFSILLGPAPHLDGRYTIFGELESGWEVIQRVLEIPLSKSKRPIHRIEVLQAFSSPDVPIRMPSPVQDWKLLPLDYFVGAESQDVNLPTSLAVAPILILLASLMIIFGISIFSFSQRFSPRQWSALGLILTLIGFFFFFTLISSKSIVIPWGSTAILFGAVGVFKLMSRFEAR